MPTTNIILDGLLAILFHINVNLEVSKWGGGGGKDSPAPPD